eukprot:scaffold1340_cov253-Pinguiococcus_pyrenoidosus.AAC.10
MNLFHERYCAYVEPSGALSAPFGGCPCVSANLSSNLVICQAERETGRHRSDKPGKGKDASGYHATLGRDGANILPPAYEALYRLEPCASFLESPRPDAGRTGRTWRGWTQPAREPMRIPSRAAPRPRAPRGSASDWSIPVQWT